MVEESQEINVTALAMLLFTFFLRPKESGLASARPSPEDFLKLSSVDRGGQDLFLLELRCHLTAVSLTPSVNPLKQTLVFAVLPIVELSFTHVL